MSQVTLDFNTEGKVTVTTKDITVDSSIPPDPDVQKIVKDFSGKLNILTNIL